MALSTFGTVSFARVSNNVQQVTSVKEASIVTGKDVLAYRNKWKEAYLHSGVIIPVDVYTVSSVEDVLHARKSLVSNFGIVYDTSRIVAVHNDVILSSEVIFNPYIIFWIVAMLSIAVAILLFVRGKWKSNDRIIEWIAFCIYLNFIATVSAAVTVATIFTFPSGIAILTILGAITSLVFMIDIVWMTRKTYKPAVNTGATLMAMNIYIVLMLVALSLLF